MTKRITIVMDDDLVKKLRLRQSKKLQESNKSVSFSAIVNETLQVGLKK